MTTHRRVAQSGARKLPSTPVEWSTWLDDLLSQAGVPTPMAPHPTLEVWGVHTPLGPMVAGSTPAGLCMLEFADRPTLSAQVRALAQSLGGGVAARPGALGDALTSQIDSYFSSSLRAFTLPLQMIGTPFQVRAWQALTHIPYGTRRAYGEQAAAVGNPRAVRAVARANGQNPIAIVVPCHRVVGADGSLTGYGGGVERKQRLLDLEGGVRNLFAVG